MKLQSQDVRIVSELNLPEPKTKHMVKIYKALGIDRTCLLATDGPDQNVQRSARNLDRTTLTTVSQLNAWDILKNRTLLVTKSGFEKILA